MSNINVRSPYYITTGTVTGLNSTTIEIYIYTGARITDRPSTPTYNLEGFAIKNEVTFEIGELIKDYISQTFTGTYSTSILDRKSTRLNSSHLVISYAVFCLKKKKTYHPIINTI